MNTIKTQSTMFTDFSAILKDMINNGVYFLYSVTIPNKENVKYVLSTNTEYYLLSETGKPIEKINSIADLELKNRILFSDISTTVTNNSVLQWAY